MRDKTGARIIFPSEKDKDRDVITILGTKEAVAQAKKELESRIKDLVSNCQFSIWTEKSLIILNQLQFLFGR